MHRTANKFEIIMPLLLCWLVASAPTLMAGIPGETTGEGSMRGRHFERIAEALDLNEQQISEIRTLHEGREEVSAIEHDAIRALSDELDQMMESDRPDPTAIGDLVLEIHRRRDAMRAAREGLHAEMLEILTPEQRERFELLEQMRPERGRRGRHHGRRSRHHGD